MNDQDLSESPQIDPSMWLENYGDALFRFALVRLRDRDAAEEVVQETMVSALKNVGQYSGRGTESAWLFGILKMKVIDFFRSRNRDKTVNLGEDSSISDILFDENGSWKKEVRATMRCSMDSLDRQEFWNILEDCLLSLPDRQAGVFVLRTINEMTAEEVCKELEISPTNYWVIIHRARLQLSSCMTQRWFQEGN